MSQKNNGECPNHPLNDDSFCTWVYMKAINTPSRVMVNDNHFVSGITKAIARSYDPPNRGDSNWGCRNPSSYHEPDTPGGVMLLHREYKEGR